MVNSLMGKRRSKPHKPRRNSWRKARIESLEARQMLAGDVLVAVAGGNLVVTGDDLDNQIAIYSWAEPGQFVVVGLNGTNVSMANGNGSPPGEGGGEGLVAPENAVVVNGVRRGARIRMGDGDDLVVINDARFNGNVSIATGEGDDTVRIGVPVPGPNGPPIAEGDELPTEPDASPDVSVGNVSVGIRGSLRIRTGAGGDTVRVDNANIGRNLAVVTGGGDDSVSLGHRPAADPGAEGETEGVPHGDGPDASLRVRGRVHVRLGEGNDELGIRGVRARAIAATGGVGDDDIGVAGTDSRALFISGGRGDGADRVNVRNANARMAAIRTGGGDDHVAITDSAFGLLAVGLGEGNDVLALGGTSARLALLSGGPGEEDLFRNLGENMLAHQRIRGFELPPVSEDDANDEGPSEPIA